MHARFFFHEETFTLATRNVLMARSWQMEQSPLCPQTKGVPMKRSFVLMLVVTLMVFVLSACSPAQGVAQTVVELPDPLQALIGLGVLYVVGLLLRGRIPDQYVMEIAAAITTALITVIGLLLQMIPLEFEPLANTILTLIVVLLGMLTAARMLFVAAGKKEAARRVHLLP
jgi:predicted small secreted protein/small basic protein